MNDPIKSRALVRDKPQGAGVIESVGEGVGSLRAGDHVVCALAVPCGKVGKAFAELGSSSFARSIVTFQ